MYPAIVQSDGEAHALQCVQYLSIAHVIACQVVNTIVKKHWNTSIQEIDKLPCDSKSLVLVSQCLHGIRTA